ncbi:MAG: ribosome silencing factor [Phycisphaeraceae bacterium]|nr:ribosome silencing factor [Phycisphaeraceae bacterium]
MTQDPQPAPSRPARTDPALARAFAIDVARMLHDDKCSDILLLDVTGMSQVTDFIIIGTGTSDRQMRSALMHVEELGSSRGMRTFHSSTDDRATWLLADFVDVVVHLFEPSTRTHYDLEMLWGDAPRLAWERPDQIKRDMAGLGKPVEERPR